MATTFIYALCEPGTRTVRYIGKTDNPKRRLRDHVNRSSTFKTHLGCWLQNLKTKNETPSLVILREVSEEEWPIAEERYIRLARGLGMDLVNGSEGGEGLKMTPELRKKISDSHKGKVFTPTHRANMSAARKGVPHPRGRNYPPFSVSHRESISRATIGERNPNFGKTGLANATFGTKTLSASSQYVGVYWNEARQNWASRITSGGKLHWLGRFKTETAAARAYDKGAIRLLGPLVSLNFPL